MSTKSQTTSVSFFRYMEKVIARLEEAGRHGTAKNYRAAFNSFNRFRNHNDISVTSIDPMLLNEYQTHLKSEGLTMNSISFYMRILRAVYNQAVADDLSKKQRPFRSVFTGITKTRKKAIPYEEIKQIKDLDLSHDPRLEHARDIFIFLFLCRGMSFIDAAYLKKSNITDGILTYRRHKTGQLLHIKVIKQMKDLIDRFARADSPFLLPIIKEGENDERRQYETALRQVNKNLKKVGEIAGVSRRLSTYVSRHSWATIAKRMNIPLTVISEALGHESIATTQIYLDSLDSSAIDLANDLIVKDL